MHHVELHLLRPTHELPAVSISILRDCLKNGPTNFLPFYHTINELLKAEALGKLAMEGNNVVLQLLHAAEKLTIALDPEASGHQARVSCTPFCTFGHALESGIVPILALEYML